MRRSALQILTLLITCTENVLGGLTVYPRDTQVIAGDTAKLTCSTNNPSRAIYWNYYPVGVDPSSPDSRPTYVYRYGDVIKRFRARFQVERNESEGATNLVIGQVNASDAGTYICQDNDGFGETGRAQLIVLGATASEESKSSSSYRPRSTANIQTSTKSTTLMTVTTFPTPFPLIPIIIAVVVTVLIGALAVALILIWQRHRKQIQTMVVRAEQLAFRRAPERICYREEPIAIHTIRLVHADERQQRRIRGVAVLGQEVFVVSSRCPEIVVYDASSFSEQRRFDLPGLVDAWDIVSCPINNCLYVMDGKEPNADKEIIRFESSGDVKSFWSTRRKAGYLSVARDGRVVLAVYAKNVVVEYSSEGERIRKIRITSISGEIHPHHAFKLETGHFLAIHGIGDSLHRACIINEDTGALVKSFGGKKGSGDGHMNLPKYLAVDSAGSVMVLDQNNNRVLLLGFDLQYQAELVASRHGLQSPCKIHLNESSGRLYVAEFDKIHVFDILQKNAVMEYI